MNTNITVAMQAEPARIFELAARVEDWPVLLPHYRWVRVLRDDGRRRLVEMAARRDRIPVRWTAIQERYPEEGRITFHHVRGATRGMDVAWTLRPSEPPGTTLVQIWHGFEPHWPLVPARLVDLVVGQYFVNGIAARTLAGLRAHAERESGVGYSGSVSPV
jgi:ribosome-associated toxin RatA of RatAB toxin-antitoxin module